MTWPAPARVTGPFVALAGLTGAAHVISRTTGSGWLVVTESFLLAVLGLGALAPVVALLGVQIGVRAPADATASRPATFTVAARGRARGLQLRLLRPAGGWVRVDGPADGSLVAVPARRGVVEQVVVEVRAAAPFGLVWWRRRLPAPLEAPMLVGPLPSDARGAAEAAAVEGSDEGVSSPAAAGDLPRGVRDYTSGDPQRLVSWGATARHGRLMVKEMESRVAAPRLTLVVDLRGDPQAAEEAASRAAGMAIRFLRDGAEVVLATAEAAGPRLGVVRSPVDVGRRLAVATGERPPAAPASSEGVVLVSGRDR